MLRFGNITEIDVAKCYARVKFMDDGIVSAPLQIVVMGALSTKFFHIFDINEQVACLMDENSEEGVILGALFSDEINPIGGSADKVNVVFPDNSKIEYDRSTHNYTININGSIDINASEYININSQGEVKVNANIAKVIASEINLTGSTNIIGSTSIQGNLAVTGNIISDQTISAVVALSAPAITAGTVQMIDGNLTMTGDITTTGKVEGTTVKQGSVVLGTHIHGGVQTGTGTTSTPT